MSEERGEERRGDTLVECLDLDRLLWNERRDGDMRPGKTAEIKKDELRVLDLSGSNRESRRGGNIMRRSDQEGLHLGAGMRGRGLDLQSVFTDLEGRDDEFVLHLIDPEGSGHLCRVCVGVCGLGVAEEESDVCGSTAEFGGGGKGGDGEDGGVEDGFADVVVA